MDDLIEQLIELADGYGFTALKQSGEEHDRNILVANLITLAVSRIEKLESEVIRLQETFEADPAIVEHRQRAADWAATQVGDVADSVKFLINDNNSRGAQLVGARETISELQERIRNLIK